MQDIGIEGRVEADVIHTVFNNLYSKLTSATVRALLVHDTEAQDALADVAKAVDAAHHDFAIFMERIG